MTVPERLLQKKEIGFSLESLIRILSQEQQKTTSQYLEIVPATDTVNNMIVPHGIYSIPERFATFQSIFTHYQNEVQGKEIGGVTK